MKPSSTTALHSVTLLALLTFAIASMVGLAGLSPFSGFTLFQGVLLGLEFLIYAGVLAAIFSRVDILQILAISVFAIAMRGGLCLIAGALGYHLLPVVSGGEAAAPHFLDIGLNLWVNEPYLMAMQVALTLLSLVSYMGLHQVSVRKEAKTGARQQIGGSSRGMESRVNLPVGGFIQCYSYSDLHDLMRKLPGVMGFALATDEGLLVTGEGSGLPFPLDSTVVRLQIGSALLSEYQRRSGLPVDELWQFSEEYTLIMMSVEPCFFLLIFVKPTVELYELRPRISALRRSAEIFLSERHALLVKPTGDEVAE